MPPRIWAPLGEKDFDDGFALLGESATLSVATGSTPVATSEVSVMTSVTARMVMTKANGTSRRGFDASPAGTPDTPRA